MRGAAKNHGRCAGVVAIVTDHGLRERRGSFFRRTASLAKPAYRASTANPNCRRRDAS